ncbi:MAG TPA: amidase, partial [Anaerolineales bacterium]|nr:amidase [Anaerolineales bacterium]
MDNPNTLTIFDALEALRGQKLSARELVEACAQQIERLNSKLNAFITIIPPDEGLRAQHPDGKSSSTHSLRDIPLAIKDLFDIAGLPTTIGSKFFADHIAEQDGFVIEKLRQAGAILMGKTNTHEIALGITGNNPHYGTARNPWDTTRIPGGSSSGSAIAVATGMALGALGSDTGGSIRIPASLCGVVGFKPTFGRVSLRGVFPLSWNLDHVGPLT